MKTSEFTTPEATREALADLVATGHILHGSPTLDLPELIPSETGFDHRDSQTHGRIPKESLLCGSTDPDYTIFFAGAHAPARDLRKAHALPSAFMGSATTGEYDESGNFLHTLYFAADGTKHFVRRREELGMYGAIYFYKLTEDMIYRERDRDWVIAGTVTPRGSLSVSIGCLSFNFYDLPHPNSHPIIGQLNKESDKRLAERLAEKTEPTLANPFKN